jgi:hypothetical protein
MRVPLAIAATSFMILSTSASMAQDSTQNRLQRMMMLQARIADLQVQVVNAPDDRQTFRTLLETGLQYYELIYTGSRFPDGLRNEILDLKIAMQDMYAIQRAVAEVGRPIGLDGNELTNRLQSRKVPSGHRRSVPLVDPWGTPYRFFVYPQNGQYKIVSAGRGRKFDTADLGISWKELAQAPERRNASLDDDIVFIDGRNFTRLFDYPKEAQTFLYTLCEPADEVRPDQFRCW